MFGHSIVPVAIGLAVCALGTTVPARESGQSMWDMKALSKAPAVYPAPGLEPVHEKAPFYETMMYTPEIKTQDASNNRVRSLFYEGLPFQGKPTRVFAYYGTPDVPKGTKVPAMVLVHGGGGTAFETWVRMWNARGYAAIAMDTCGSVPKGSYSAWERDEQGGSPGWGGLDQLDWPVHDQWTYHAIADVILANSLIRSFPEVDPDRIGVTGVSWGGYLTSMVSGVDSRFRFAVPVYGCGFLGESSVFVPTVKQMGEKGQKWLSLWDPSVYLKYTKIPTLWVNGTNDFAFFMDSWLKSTQITHGPKTLCLRVNMLHGHGWMSEIPEEIHAIADHYCKGGAPLLQVTGQGRDEKNVWVKYKCSVPVKKVELNFTRDTGNWPERKWETVPGELDGKGKVKAVLPAGTRLYYLNLIDTRDLIVSTEHVTLAQAVD